MDFDFNILPLFSWVYVCFTVYWSFQEYISHKLNYVSIYNLETEIQMKTETTPTIIWCD